MSVPLSVTGLRVTYSGREVLKGVDLQVEPGEIVAVMGISGGGKTSLLKCLAGLQRPTAGSIRIGSVELTELSEGELNEQRVRMGMVFQYAALFDSLTVYENVVFGLRHHTRNSEQKLREIAVERLSAVGMEG